MNKHQKIEAEPRLSGSAVADLARMASRFLYTAFAQGDPPPRTRVKTRNPLPEALLEKAVVPGYERVRLWGDLFTPEYEQALIEKNEQVRASAAAGIMPDALKQADFLAISGGGDKGAFAAGLLRGWTERGTRPTFELVTGVSAGALAAPFAFLGPDFDKNLEQIYTENGAAQLFKSRGFRGFFSDALNDTHPLEALIRENLTDDCLDRIAEEHQKGRRLIVMTTNLDAQRQVVWALSGIAASSRPDRRDLFVKVLRASSALPGLFPPVVIDVMGEDGKMYDELHVDGGVTAELLFIPPESKILHIEKKVFPAPRKRSLYVIENGKLSPEYIPSELKVMKLALRSVATMVKYQVIDNLLSLALVVKANKGYFYFNAIPSSFKTTPKAPFDKAYAKALYAAGHEVGLSGKWGTTPPASPTLGIEEVQVCHRRH